jgi:DUF4097 and DUF4098 domain-containing protein YvlB
VTAKTLGGAVKLAGHLLGVDASTIGGSIKVEGAYGPVAASTKGGSIQVAGRLSGSCSLDTAGGSIRVELVADSNITVDATGDGTSTDFDTLTADRGHLAGTIGTGEEGRLVARTVAGSVSIRRA